jgi:hypothetical protein
LILVSFFGTTVEGVGCNNALAAVRGMADIGGGSG